MKKKICFPNTYLILLINVSIILHYLNVLFRNSTLQFYKFNNVFIKEINNLFHATEAKMGIN